MHKAGGGQSRSQQQQQQQQQQLSASKLSTTTGHEGSIGSGSSDSSSSSSNYQTTDTIVKRTTPVLYCTSRGLYLRLAKMPSVSSTSSLFSAACSTDASQASRRKTNSNISPYELKFCDLERWSTNRANTIGLNDTMASRTFTVQKNNSFNPIKHSMVRFETSDSRSEQF